MLTSILNERDLFIAASDLFLGRTKTDNQHSKLKPMEYVYGHHWNKMQFLMKDLSNTTRATFEALSGFNKRVTEALLHDIQQDDDFESK